MTLVSIYNDIRSDAYKMHGKKYRSNFGEADVAAASPPLPIKKK